MVTFTSSSIVAPTAVRIALMLSKTCRVWTAISRATTWPVTGSTGTVPEMNRKSPARTACEYGPTGFTALSVKTTCLDLAIELPPCYLPASLRCRAVRQGDRSFSIVGDVIGAVSRAHALGPAQQLGRSIRAHREAARLSLGTLAAKSGVSKANLSTIEAGAGNPSLETLWRLAGALGLSLGVLLGEAGPHQVGTEEFVLCIAGTLEIGPIDQEQMLRPGDSLWFPADREHRYASRRGARGLSVISYPTLREA